MQPPHVIIITTLEVNLMVIMTPSVQLSVTTSTPDHIAELLEATKKNDKVL